jgi:prephenate dehydrogenase
VIARLRRYLLGTVQPKRLTILGVGLLGGSIALALKAAGASTHITGYGHRRATLDTALKLGVIDQASDHPADSVRNSDWVILCTPVGLFETLLNQIAPALARNVIVTDVGSTKRSVVAAAESILPKTSHFVGSHPMAGSEKRGVEFARADLFKGARSILTPTPRTDRTALQQVDEFWQTIGMRTVQMTPDDHDRLICDVSHLPHALSAALVAMQHDDALPLAGAGFLDTTRVAGGDGALWRDILLDNRDNLTDSITRLRAQLDHLLTLLTADQSDELRKWLDAAAQRRATLLSAKLKELHPE